MTLREKILQTFVVTIREINRHGGPKEFFEKYPVGGFFYRVLPETIGIVEDGTGTNYERLKECRKYSKIPLLVCADGCRVPGQTISAGASSIAGSKSVDDAYNLGKLIGMQCNSNGVDWVLTPSIDILYSRNMSLTAVSDDPVVTAELYRNVVRGIQDQGVCATVKHFPGLGTNNINMHFAPGRNTLPFEEWMDSYGYTYKEMFKEGVMSVMTTHTALKSYTDERENGYYPIATFSHKLTTELLKEKLGFEGAVVTDALIMGGMATGNLVEETVQAFKAGADVLLWPPIEAAERIEELILNGEIPMSRLDDALSRIQKLREFRNKALTEVKVEAPDAEKANQIAKTIISNGICEYKNKIGLLPLNKETVKKILIIDAGEKEDMKPSLLLADALKKVGFSVDVKRDIYDVSSNVCWQSDIDELQASYDVVIFSVNTSYLTDWGKPFMLIWASQLFDKKKKIIINYGSPLFAEDYFPDEYTIIEVNASPTATSTAFVAEGIIGKRKFTGKKVLSGRLAEKI